MDVVGFLHGSDKRKRKRRHEGYRFCVGKCVHGLDCRSKLASTRRPQFGCRRCPRPRLESKSKSKSKEQTKRTDRSTQTTAVRAHYSVETPSPKAEWTHAVRMVISTDSTRTRKPTKALRIQSTGLRHRANMGLGDGKVAIVVEFEAHEGRLEELRAALVEHARCVSDDGARLRPPSAIYPPINRCWTLTSIHVMSCRLCRQLEPGCLRFEGACAWWVDGSNDWMDDSGFDRLNGFHNTLTNQSSRP